MPSLKINQLSKCRKSSFIGNICDASETDERLIDHMPLTLCCKDQDLTSMSIVIEITHIRRHHVMLHPIWYQAYGARI